MVMVTIVTVTGCRGCANNPFSRFFGNQTESPLLPGDALESSSLPEPIRGQTPQRVEELRTVFFEFDSSNLVPRAQQDLMQNADWMRRNPNFAIQIEGHCDIIGTPEYNFALGQRRADAVRQFLISQGIAPSRLHTISYGSEMPAVDGNDEAAFARNRRAEFLVFTQ
jgi:peptidoglycan-associated lipoprotein